MVGQDLVRAFYRLFYLQFCYLSDQSKNTVQQRFCYQFEEYLYIKTVVTIYPTGLVTNWLLSSFCPFLKTKFSASCWSGYKKQSCFLFIASRTLLQSHPKFNILLQKKFLTCYSCLHYSSIIRVLNRVLNPSLIIIPG